MEITQIVTQWIGLIIGLLLSGALFLFALGWAGDQLIERWNSFIHKRVDAYLRESGVRMENQLYWFSSLEQMAMWAAIADSLRYGYIPDVQNVRDHVFKRKLDELTKRYPHLAMTAATTAAKEKGK